MTPGADQLALLGQFSSSWPEVDRISLPAPGESFRLTQHRLAGEIEALVRGAAASLPYHTRNRVGWVTVAPSAEALRAAVEGLRAWVIPSVGWEDASQPYVAPDEARGRLGTPILLTSPAGYFRWHCEPSQFNVVVARLQAMRRLAARRPAFVRDRLPSLLELRQRFRLCLLTGDRRAAEKAVQEIDLHQLDSALNTQLMRVRLRDAFFEYDAIVADPALDTIVRARLPNAVRIAIVRAHVATYLAPFERAGEYRQALEAYGAQVHPVVGGLLEFCRGSDGLEVAKALTYRALRRADWHAAKSFSELYGGALHPLLVLIPDGALETGQRGQAPVAETAAIPASTIGDQWHDAVSRWDVRRVQELGLEALSQSSKELPLVVRAGLSAVLRESLEELPNALLDEALRVFSGREGIPFERPALAQTWTEFLDRVRHGNWDVALRFIEAPERPTLEAMSQLEFDAAAESMEELLTDPSVRMNARAARVLADGLPVFVEEFVSEPEFPRSPLCKLYMQLLRLWVEVRRGSTFPPDGQVLLVLALAVLQSPERQDAEVGALVREWWDARRVPALLPYALEAVELLVDQCADQSMALGLWLDGAVLVRTEAAELVPGERELWRRLGARLGVDSATVDDCLGPDGVGALETDPLQGTGLEKIAIVSLQQRAAEEAGALISERTGAQVSIIAETEAGKATKNAATADAILFVWSANKHAVYRAFDTVRERLVYVQGTGAGSIVRALERWAAKRLAPVV